MTARLISNRPTDVDLRRLYVDEGVSAAAIARDLGCDPTTVRHWLIAAGVQMRPRGDLANMGGKRRSSDWRPTPEQVERTRGATIRRGGVPYLKDGKHWLDGAPPEMNPRWLGGVTADRQAFYAGREWKEACATIWWRADACCERCEADAREAPRKCGAFHIHHIVSFKVVELRADPANLVLLCRACHLWVHSRANVDRDFLASDRDGIAAWEAVAEARWEDEAARIWDQPTLRDQIGLRYLRIAEAEAQTPTLFDFLDGEVAA